MMSLPLYKTTTIMSYKSIKRYARLMMENSIFGKFKPGSPERYGDTVLTVAERHEIYKKTLEHYQDEVNKYLEQKDWCAKLSVRDRERVEAPDMMVGLCDIITVVVKEYPPFNKDYNGSIYHDIVGLFPELEKHRPADKQGTMQYWTGINNIMARIEWLEQAIIETSNL